MLLKEWLEEISLINFGKEFQSLAAANLKLVWPRLIHTFGISRSISRSCLPIFLKITFGSHLEFKAFFLFNTGYLTEHAFHGRPRRYQPTKVELLSFKNKKKTVEPESIVCFFYINLVSVGKLLLGFLILATMTKMERRRLEGLMILL